MIIIEVKACKFNEAKIAKLDRNKSVEFKPNKDLVCKGDYCKLLKNPFTR